MENSAVCAEHMEPHEIEANAIYTKTRQMLHKKSQKSIASSRDVTITKRSPSSNAISYDKMMFGNGKSRLTLVRRRSFKSQY